MKFSIAIVSSLVASAAGAALRASVAEDLVSTQVHLQVGGLVREPSKDELVVLDKILVDNMNKAYANQETVKFESKETFDLTNDKDAESTSMIVSEFVAYGGGGYCKFCPKGDDLDWGCYIDPNCGRLENAENYSEEQILAVKAGNIHAQFEKKICRSLRKSGVANFAQAKDCSFSFIEDPGTMSIRLSEEDAYESLNGEATVAEVSFRGLGDNELSVADNKFLESVILKAHSDAFHSAGYKLLAFDMTSFLGTSTDKTWISLARAVPTIDEDSTVLTPSSMVALHETFEQSVCSSLQESGRIVFHAVDECRFRFVYNPTTESKIVAAVPAVAAAMLA